MNIATIKVSGVKAVTNDYPTIPAGIVGATVTFEFTDPAWDGLSKTAVFRGCVTRDVLMTGNVVRIPAETVAQACPFLFVGVYGTDAADNLVIPTLWLSLGTVRDAADPSGDPGTDPDLPIWAQLQDRVEALESSTPSDPGSPGTPGQPGEDGEDGGYYTPAVTQPSSDTVEFAFSPSKPDMPAVDPVQVKLPVSQGSGGNLDVSKYGLPVLYLTGDVSAMNKDNAVDLTYVYGDRSGTASVKWQGSSSLSYPKKNYTIKFDNAFEAVEGWGEQKKYCLKANYIDFSHARNVVSAKLWGQVVKSRASVNERIADLPNAGAVDGFPVCVFINEKYQGLYTFNIPKDGWMLGMGDGETECIMCANHHSSATKFAATALCDESDFEIEYVPDEANTQWAIDSLNRLITVVMASDGSDIDSIIAKYVDLDSAIDFFIFTVLISGADNYDKNHILATYDGIKWFFTMYDMDGTWGLDAGGTKWYSPTKAYPTINQFNHKLVQLLSAYKTDTIKARFAELTSGVLSVSNVMFTFANFITAIPKALYDEECRLWPKIPSSSINNLHQIIDNYSLRVSEMRTQVEALENLDIIQPSMLMSEKNWYRATTPATDITQINIVSNYAETGNETEIFNADVNDNGNIKGFITGTVLTLSPTTGAKKIALPGTSTALFNSFKNVVEINGTERLTNPEGGKFSFGYVFENLTKLTSKIYIPEGATSMDSTFANCKAMVEAPEIPSTATSLFGTFFGCAFKKPPKIPANFAGSIRNIFYTASGITDVDGYIVPEGVTDIANAFHGLANASGTITINAQNLTDYANAFRYAATAEGCHIYLTGSCPLLAEIAATDVNGNVTVLGS